LEEPERKPGNHKNCQKWANNSEEEKRIAGEKGLKDRAFKPLLVLHWGNPCLAAGQDVTAYGKLYLERQPFGRCCVKTVGRAEVD